MRGIIIIVLLLPLLAGCSWFAEKANPPLEGERQNVLPKADQTAQVSSAIPEFGYAQAVTSWTQVNQNSEQAGVNAQVMPEFTEAWRVSIGDAQDGRKRLTARPVAAEGKIFAMDNRGRVTAIDANSGEKIWEVRTRQFRSGALAGGLAYDAGRLFVTSGLSEIAALSAANGGELWKIKLDAPARSAPVAAAGRVFVVTRGSQSFGLDAASGKILWQHHGLLENAGVLSGAAPAVSDDMLVAGYPSGEVTALSPGNGSVLWGENLSSGRPENNLATLHDLRAPPVILNDMVIVANYASQTTAADRRMGERVWSHNFGALQPMTVSGDTLYLISTGAQLIALNRKTGGIYWSKPLQTAEREPEDPQEYWYGPLLLNGHLFVISTNGEAELRDAKTGDVTATFTDLPNPAENPIVAGDMIIWPTATGELAAYR